MALHVGGLGAGVNPTLQGYLHVAKPITAQSLVAGMEQALEASTAAGYDIAMCVKESVD